MKKTEIINPRSRNRSKIKFFLRKLEDCCKNIFLCFIILSNFFLSLFFTKKKYIDFNNYIDFYAVNYFTYSLKNNFIFTYNLINAFTIVRRIGIQFFLFHFKPNCLTTNCSKLFISYNKKINETKDINLDFDYFKPFDNDDFASVNSGNSIFLPYYFYADFYKKNLIKNFLQLRNNKKTIPIVFSGSTHPDWYDQFPWEMKPGEKNLFMSRTKILDYVIQKYPNEVAVIENNEQFQELSDQKKIILFLSNPSKRRKESKIFSIDKHMEIISKANFFLTCPGTAMPLCHHLIESLFLGTVPITSYGHLIYPFLDNSNSFSFNNYEELNRSIDSALSLEVEKKIFMQENAKKYYDQHLSPHSFLELFLQKKMPINIIMNIDGHSYDERRNRFGLSRVYPLPGEKN